MKRKKKKKIELTEEQKDEVDNVKKKVEEYDQINSKDEVDHTGEKNEGGDVLKITPQGTMRNVKN